MDLSSTEEQVQLRDSVRRLLDKVSGPEAVRAAEPAGHGPSIIAGLAEIGAFAMGLPESLGGFDASLADLAVVATEAGSHLAMAPVVEALVAGRALASASASVDLGDWIDSVASGGRLVTFAPRPTRDGVADLVPGGAVADAAVLLDGDELVLVTIPEGSVTQVSNTARTALGDLDPSRATERVVLRSGDAAPAAFAVALDEWRALTACWLVGLGRSALALGTQYAIERKQFDVPIGSFQAVAHRLADVATDLDGADLLAAKAVWALDEGEDVGARFAATAFWFAGEAAQAVASAALHVHGGYGFMEEYDVQLHFRRAKSTRLLLGDPRRELLTLATRIFDTSPPATTTKPVIGPAAAHADEPRRGPDFRLGVAVEAFRDDVHDFLAEHVTDEVIERAHTTGTIHDWGLHRAMAAQGWISAGWPAEYGGGGRSPLEMNVLSEEMYLSGAPVDGIGVASLVAHTILLEGSEWQKATVIPQIISGEVICCLGYSEPESGSDVAACATRAVRDGDTWTIDGSKMFTTLAHEAGYVFLLTRTNTEVAKHKGLTMFVVPMDTPGIEISPVHTMGGERTNITYYDGVQVDDRYRVGEVDGGWKVMMTALVFERNAAWYGEAVRLLDHAVQWAASTTSADGGLMIDDPLVRERLARAAVGNEVANLLGWRAAWLASIGTLPGVEGTMAKLFTTEHYQRSASDLLDLLGVDGVRRHGDPRAPADGWIEATYRHSQVTTIYGGTSEVLRNIIAQRGLGLPRSA
jgi:alkylation response protein AidB-like acyl-CoA dehydrogenase